LPPQQNELTGEHTCIMLKPLEASAAPAGWLDVYWKDFQSRFVSLLSFSFRVRKRGTYEKVAGFLAKQSSNPRKCRHRWH
jgi:tRNA(Met) C34 N-acetyltransferase TmcA